MGNSACPLLVQGLDIADRFLLSNPMSLIKSHIDTIIAVVITSNTRLALAPGNVFLSRRVSNLPKDSVANVSQLITIDKSFLTEKIGNFISRTP